MLVHLKQIVSIGCGMEIGMVQHDRSSGLGLCCPSKRCTTSFRLRPWQGWSSVRAQNCQLGVMFTLVHSLRKICQTIRETLVLAVAGHTRSSQINAS